LSKTFVEEHRIFIPLLGSSIDTIWVRSVEHLGEPEPLGYVTIFFRSDPVDLVFGRPIQLEMPSGTFVRPDRVFYLDIEPGETEVTITAWSPALSSKAPVTFCKC